jgi:hypothetical protein
MVGTDSNAGLLNPFLIAMKKDKVRYAVVGRGN